MTKKLERPIAFLSAFAMFMTILLYFPVGTFSSIDWGIKASADEITPTEPSADDKGVYQIETAEELYWFAGLVNGTLDGVEPNTSANAVLTKDITVNENLLDNLKNDGTFTEGYNVKDWTPIGNGSNQYAGTFDGNNYTISGLYFNDENKINVGLFGYKCGTVKNVGVVDSYFKGDYNVGGVCGKNANGTITNCYNTGTVSGTSGNVGGVCGINDDGTITNCYNTGTVNGIKYVGGVCGQNNGTITNCYNTGTVTGNGEYDVNVGGVCGKNANGTITNCYNTGTVSGTQNVGGVCGQNNGTITNCYNTGTVTGNGKYDVNVGGVCGQNNGTITNCYNTGTVKGNGEDNVNVGGVCGYNSGQAGQETITNCYFNSDVYNGQAVGHDEGKVYKTEGKTTAQFKSGEVAALLAKGCTVNETKYNGIGWVQIVGTNDYPVLNGIYLKEPSKDEKNVYQIGTAEELYWFADKVNNGETGINAVLTADITVNENLLNSLTYDNEGNVTNDTSFTSWTPIGNDSNQYTGTFDGQNHKISGLYFNNETYNEQIKIQ